MDREGHNMDTRSVVTALDNDLSQQVQVFISVRNLPKMDVLSPSDPFVIVQLKNNKTGRWDEIAVTEIVWDNPNADFVKRITVHYLFEEVQQMRFLVLDADTKDANRLTGHQRDQATDFIGQLDVTLAELVTRQDSRLETTMKSKTGQAVKGKNKQQSKIIIRTEEVNTCQDVVLLQFSCRDLPKMDAFGRADPFLQIYRATEDGRWAAVAKTEFYKRTYNPDFKPMLLKVQQLCNGDYQRPLKIRCFDWNDNAAPDFMGECETSLDAILKGEVKEIVFRRRGKQKTYGKLVVRRKRLRQQHSFLQYIRGGMEIQLMIAVDFTGSNGDPRDHQSLHYMAQDRSGHVLDNDYLRAIRSVGAVLEPYDSDNMIPVYGFGAKINGVGSVRHCFPLTLNEDQEEVQGLAGVIDAYTRVLPQLALSGPTLLSQVISTAMAMSTDPYTAQSQQYTILLILTDGVINDKQKCTDTIVSCTDYPMSIIIVGVGNADFSTMEYLDADDDPLVHTNGTVMKRDIVQFVPFNEFKSVSPHLFSKEILAEVPDQVTSYMTQHGHAPLGYQPREEDIQRIQRYNHSVIGSPGATVLDGSRPAGSRRNSDSLLMDQLGAGGAQDRPYYKPAGGGKIAGVNTGQDDDYLYQGNSGGGCCSLM